MRALAIVLGLMLLLPLNAAQAAEAVVIEPDDILPLKKKSDGGDPDAKYRLGIAYLGGMGGLKPDTQAGMKYIEDAGKAGMREAQFFMGATLHGMNSRTNFKDNTKVREQLKWLALSFKQGCAGGAGLIAGYYVHMKGPQSPKAMDWFIKAAKGGDVASQAVLAKVAKDIDNLIEAYAWTALSVNEHPHVAAAKKQLATLRAELSAEDKPKAEELAQQFIKDYGRDGDYPFCMIGALQAVSPLGY